MRFLITTCCLLLPLAGTRLQAQDYSVEVINEPISADDLSEAIAAELAPTGYRVVQGESRAIWEIWPAKKWSVEAGFTATPVRLYPFQEGELIGVAKLRRRGSDFRDQTISRGVYTLRYALQPVDGNHIGTSPTRDFLLMVSAQEDPSPEPRATEGLLEASAEAAGSSHPAMICLQKLDDGATAPALRYLENRGWWVLRLVGKAGDDNADMPLDMVVVGHAAE